MPSTEDFETVKPFDPHQSTNACLILIKTLPYFSIVNPLAGLSEGRKRIKQTYGGEADPGRNRTGSSGP